MINMLYLLCVSYKGHYTVLILWASLCHYTLYSFVRLQLCDFDV